MNPEAVGGGDDLRLSHVVKDYCPPRSANTKRFVTLVKDQNPAI
jgi:hypothetical protein